MSRLSNAIKRVAISLAGQITKLAKANAPAHIRPAISSMIETKGEGTFFIRTTANRYMPLSPRHTVPNDVRAWEYGSGIKARRGSKQEYIIKPKTKKVLAFNWEMNTVGLSYLPDGRVVLPEVSHPGIEAANEGKGYIAPAQIVIRKKIREELSLEVRQAINGDLRTAFGKKV